MTKSTVWRSGPPLVNTVPAERRDRPIRKEYSRKPRNKFHPHAPCIDYSIFDIYLQNLTECASLSLTDSIKVTSYLMSKTRKQQEQILPCGSLVHTPGITFNMTSLYFFTWYTFKIRLRLLTPSKQIQPKQVLTRDWYVDILLITICHVKV